MKQTTIGINGFGRIGRTLFRLLSAQPHLRVVAINDLADARTLAYLLKYDSIHGPFHLEVSHTEGHILVDHREVALLNYSSPKEIPWSDHGVDIVVEATGKFKDSASLESHLQNGAKKVILSVPPLEEGIKTIVYGINQEIIN